MEQMSGKVRSLMRNKYMLWVVGAVGVVLLFNPFAWFGGQQKPTAPISTEGVATTNTSRPTMAQYEQTYEQRLTDILDTVNGVSEAKVMVNIDSSEEVQYASDTQDNKTTNSETDKTGGTRTTTTIDQSGKLVLTKQSGTDQPVVVKTIKPKVRGVVVVAKGAEQVKIQALIMDAVQRVLDVPPHKISILPKKA